MSDISVQFAVRFGSRSMHYKETLSKNITTDALISKFLRDLGQDHQMPGNYSLIVFIKDENPFYLKEENITILSKIYLMELCYKKEKEIMEIHRLLNVKDSISIKKALESLKDRLQVEEFLQECIEQRLHEEIFKLIERVINDETMAVLTMNVFSELMLYTRKKDDFDDFDDQPYISWLNVKSELIRQTLEFTMKATDLRGIDSSLKILVAYTKNRQPLKETIFSNLDANFVCNLFEKLSRTTEKKLKCSVQISIVTLLNLHFHLIDSHKDFVTKMKSFFGAERLKFLKENIDIISRNIKEFPSGLSPVGYNEPTKEENELIAQLTKLQYYILQPIYWDFSYDKSYQGPKIQQLDIIKNILPDSENISDIDAFKRLGFDNTDAPNQDFCIEKGRITFDCIHNMVKMYFDEISQFYSKIKGQDQYNFVKTCFSLVNILDRALQISIVHGFNSAWENLGNGIYLPIIYQSCEITNEYLSKGFFYELFYKCFLPYSQLLLESSSEELSELEEYFLNQLNEVLSCYPMSMQEFSSWLAKSKSENIRKKKLEAQVKEWEDSQSPSNQFVQQLRQELDQEYRITVNQKRINQLQEKPYSFNLNIKSIQKFSLQLDNSRSIILAKEEGSYIKNYKWLISSIRGITTDKECPHYNQRKGNLFYFTLHMDNQDDIKDDSASSQLKTFNFTCNNKKQFFIWVDGLNILLNKQPTSQDYRDEVLNLVRMEMKIRFLLITNDAIINTPPQLPKLPTNYDFFD